MVITVDFGMKKPLTPQIRGTTLPETAVALVLLVTFFASLFELNAVCLRYIDATKESVAALQDVQDRAEMLRNLAFTDLTKPASGHALLAAQAKRVPPCQAAA